MDKSDPQNPSRPSSASPAATTAAATAMATAACNTTTTTTTTTTRELLQVVDYSPKKVASMDRLKRDEWSEGAVSSLLEAYESKWILRNRAKLKGHDWEDVAKHVSSRSNSTKSPKTQTQCKNKIESMKKRYRSESAAADASSWPLFPRLDLLLRGTAAAAAAVQLPGPVPTESSPLLIPERSLTPPPDPVVQLGIHHRSDGGAHRETKEDGTDAKLPEHDHKNDIETDSSTPALYSNEKEISRSKNHKTKMHDHNLHHQNKKKRRSDDDWDIAESIRWLAEVVVRSEQARVETMKELEKMRAEADAKRSEIDLRRTEIIASTQLEIARLFASLGKGVDPSLKIGRS